VLELHPANGWLDGINCVGCVGSGATGSTARRPPRTGCHDRDYRALQPPNRSGATVSEANGRASIYLAALSSNLIALAFIGQISRLGTAFYAFALILLPVLAFMGAVTFQRLVQSSLEDIAYAQRIARLRAFYIGLAPELEPFLLVVDGPRAEGVLDHKRLGPSAWQLMLTTAGMVGVVNSAVIGACAGLAVETLPIGSFVVVLTAGSITGAVTLLLHRRHHRRARDAYRPEGIDRAAIFAPVAQEAGAV
jgi:hypothetical protein